MKTPLGSFDCSKHPKHAPPSKVELSSTSDRLVRHYRDLATNCEDNEKSALVLICFMYNADPFKPPSLDSLTDEKVLKRAKYIGYEVQKATEKGVQTWQVNLSLDKDGVSLSKYFKLNFMDDEPNKITLTNEEIKEFRKEEEKKAKKHEEALEKAKKLKEANKAKKRAAKEKEKKKKAKKQKN